MTRGNNAAGVLTYCDGKLMSMEGTVDVENEHTAWLLSCKNRTIKGQCKLDQSR